MRILREKESLGIRAIDVKEEQLRAYNDWIQEERARFSWGVGSCSSYYHRSDGHTPFLFPGDITSYKQQREEAGLRDFEVL